MCILSTQDSLLPLHLARHALPLPGLSQEVSVWHAMFRLLLALHSQHGPAQGVSHCHRCGQERDNQGAHRGFPLFSKVPQVVEKYVKIL